MTESQPQGEGTPPPANHKVFEPTIVNGTFRDLLEQHLGEVFLIANPESFEETGIGHKITAGWYKAKLMGLGADYLIVLTEFAHGTGRTAKRELIKQYIPLARIKRVSLMHTERLIHI